MKSSGLISTKLLVKFTMLVLSIAICLSPAWAGKETVTVMTRNLYIGAEIQSLAGADTELEFLLGVLDALDQMADNNFSERAEALAAEIAEKEPHLVALQEVYDITFNGGYPILPFTNYLDDLLNALDDQGVSYYVAAVVNNLNQSFALTGLGTLGILDRDVILAREDVETNVVDLRLGFGGFCPPNRQSEDGCNYFVVARADTPVGEIAFQRGFVAVDAWIDGFGLRFFDTHLEVRDPDPSNPASPLVQRYQAAELVDYLALPPPHNGPVIVAGDINSSPEDSGAISGPYPPYTLYPPYMQIEDAGNLDAWTLRPGKPRGYTCCFEEDLFLPGDLYERIDVIFSSMLPDRVKANVVGNDESDLTFSGLWPSDHAGVVARLFFEPFPMPQKPSKAKKRR